MAYYHVRITRPNQWTDFLDLDLSEDQVRDFYVRPWEAGQVIVRRGERIDPADIRKIRINTTEASSAQLLPGIRAERRRSRVAVAIPDEWYVTEQGTDVTDDYIRVAPGSGGGEHPELAADSVELVLRICEGFPRLVGPLQRRHANRPPLAMEDEYDVQDLLEGLLRVLFEDVRKEDSTAQFAGRSVHPDFVLKTERIGLEVKKTRKGLADKQLGDELLQDIARYAQHQDCDTLIIFMYDPERRITNPAGLVADLEASGEKVKVRAVVVT